MHYRPCRPSVARLKRISYSRNYKPLNASLFDRTKISSVCTIRKYFTIFFFKKTTSGKNCQRTGNKTAPGSLVCKPGAVQQKSISPAGATGSRLNVVQKMCLVIRK